MTSINDCLPEGHAAWRFTKEQESRFTAKVCLIATQGEQQDSAEYEIGIDKNGDDSDADTDDGQMIVDSGLPSLKRKFLDRLAEVFAREKQASFVSATAMEEYEDKVVIYVVRNKAIDEKDDRFCETLKLCLESISAKDSTADLHKSVLWEQLLSFYKGRILTHLSDLCDYIDKINKSTGSHSIVVQRFSDDNLRKLIHFCRDHREGTSSASEIRSIVELSYSVAKSYNKSPALLEYSTELDREKLLRLIRFVGRTKTSYFTFLEAAFRFPSFQKVDLVFERPLATESRVPGNLKVPFPKHIKNSLEASEMKPKKIAEMIARYDNLCAKRLHVHVEIGLLFHLLRKGSTLSRVLLYIGISKKSCFLCHHMLRGVGMFRNRGCHGVLETQWTLPRSFELASDHSERILFSFMKLQKLITRKAEMLKKTRIERKPQSEAIVSDWISMDDRLELAARMEANARIREDQAEAIFWEKQAARKDYRLKRADILVFDCWQNKVPEDETVAEDFGFMNFSDAFDRQSLFMLYKDMVTCESVSAQLLDQWLNKGCLREGIIHRYTHQKVSKLFQWQIEGSLEHNILRSYHSTGKTWDADIGDCFIWFMNNHETFSLETPNWTWKEKVEDWYAKHRPLFLEAEDHDVPLSKLEPESKQKAVQFWMETDFSIPQFPGEDTWVTFGFCTCQTKREQVRMISLYKELLQKCSFKEFWDAIRYSTMIALFDRYGLERERRSFRHFQSVMDNTRALPSAWYLKSFVYDAKAMNLPSSLRAVTVDYGFSRCRDATDRTRLRGAYREVFDQEADEFLLHKACLAGEIFNFCSPCFPTWTSADREYFQELMANPYPLIPPVPWAGLVAENAIFCKESDKEFVSKRMAAEASENVLFMIGDDKEEELWRMMGERNSYKLEGRFEGQDNSYVRLSPKEGRRANLVTSVSRVTGHQERILMLAPLG